MILNDFILDLRLRLNDNDATNGYRFTRVRLSDCIHKALVEIRMDRPDSRIDADGNPWDYAGLHEYTESGTEPLGILDYSGIRNWCTRTYPDLFFLAAASSVTAYPSAADRTANTNALSLISNTGSHGRKVVTELNSSGFSGSLDIPRAPSAADEWQVKATEADIPLDVLFFAPVMHYAAYLAYADDNEDTHNQNRMAYHLQEYLKATRG